MVLERLLMPLAYPFDCSWACSSRQRPGYGVLHKIFDRKLLAVYLPSLFNLQFCRKIFALIDGSFFLATSARLVEDLDKGAMNIVSEHLDGFGLFFTYGKVNS